MKKLKKLFFFIILAIILYLGVLIPRYLNNPINITPLPYTLKTYQQLESRHASAANVLIVGDKMGVNLKRFFPSFIEKSSVGLKDPLNVYYWAREGEGLHRTLAKIKSLKRMPEVIIYHGGTQEYFEKRINLKYTRQMMTNFKRYHNKKWLSLLITFPILSKFYYQPYPHQKLGDEIIKDEMEYTDTEIQKLIELTYLLYTAELKDMLNHIKEQDGQLIIIPPPYEIDIPPMKVCSNATSQELDKKLNLIEKDIQKGLTKKAIPKLQIMLEKNIGHARIYYLLGIALKKNGLFKDAKASLYRALSFDCNPSRGQIITNRIQMTMAEKKEFMIVDFNRIINNHFGKNTLFIDQYIPQDIFYEDLINELSHMVRKILNL